MTMSALCAFPPLIPAGGVYHHHGASLASGSYATLPVLETSARNGYARALPYASSQVYPPYSNSVKTSVKMCGEPINLWPQQQTQPLTQQTQQPTAAKRRCTEKMQQRNCGWSDAMWTANDAMTSQLSAVMCSTAGCWQQQHQPLQTVPPQTQQQHTLVANTYNPSMMSAFDVRRPLQERHLNAHDTSAVPLKNPSGAVPSGAVPSGVIPSFMVRPRQQQRQLSVDPKKDYSTPLSVDCSVEYDLPRIVRPPPGAQPLLVLAPPRSVARTAAPSVATASAVYQPMWTPEMTVKSQQVSITQQLQLKIAAANVSVPVAVPALGGSVMRNNSGDSGCVCRLCCPPPPPQWSQQQPIQFNQSPPVGATPSTVNYQQQQIPFYLEAQQQQPQQVPTQRRRKRAAAASVSVDKMARLYAASTPWIDAPAAAFAASQAAWMTSVPAPLKFHC